MPGAARLNVLDPPMLIVPPCTIVTPVPTSFDDPFIRMLPVTTYNPGLRLTVELLPIVQLDQVPGVSARVEPDTDQAEAPDVAVLAIAACKAEFLE